MDAEGRIVDWNPQAQKAFGSTPAEPSPEARGPDYSGTLTGGAYAWAGEYHRTAEGV